jgi:hypothetical protein
LLRVCALAARPPRRFQSDGYTIADIWQLRDGNFLTLTNRVADLPAGFEALEKK